MNLVVVMGLLCQHPSAGLPIQSEHPVWHWQDLDSDNRNEVWVATVEGDMCFWDPDLGNEGFRPVPCSRGPGPLQCVLVDGQPRAACYDRGVFYLYDDGEWTLWDDIRPLTSPARHGSKMMGSAFMVPVVEGYAVVEPGCRDQILPVRPAISHSFSGVSVVFPVPSSKDRFPDAWHFPPLVDAQHGTLHLVVAVPRQAGWTTVETRSSFIWGMEIANYAYGDLDGDGNRDLAILATPSEDLSIFEELSLIIIMGEADHRFAAHPLVTIKTDQNLWQTGPLVVEDQGVATYYYKGLIRSKFRRDFYAWNDAGYVEPDPDKIKWKIKDGNRGAIMTDLDFTGDGLPDLALIDEKGLRVHRRDGEGFTQQPIRPEFDTDGGWGLSISTGTGGTKFKLRSQLDQRNLFEGRSGQVLVTSADRQAEIWKIIDGPNGEIRLQRRF